MYHNSNIFMLFPWRKRPVRTYIQSVKVLRVSSREKFTCILSTNKLCKSHQKLIKIQGLKDTLVSNKTICQHEYHLILNSLFLFVSIHLAVRLAIYPTVSVTCQSLGLLDPGYPFFLSEIFHTYPWYFLKLQLKLLLNYH